MKSTKYIISSVSLGVLASLALIAPAFAATPTAPAGGWGNFKPGTHAPMQRPGVVGTVASVSGTTLTVTSQAFGRNASTTPATTYTVDASNATVMKANATSSVSAISTGDTVMVQGTVSGTSVTATKIFDGKFGMGMGGRGGMNMQHATSTATQITGNGEPVVGGKVSVVNGTSISITNSGNTTYTVDASSAKITKTGVTNATASNIAVGDEVIVQGTVNGTSITATSVMDQTNATTGSKPQAKGGILGSIGSFFSHLFGF